MLTLETQETCRVTNIIIHAGFFLSGMKRYFTEWLLTFWSGTCLELFKWNRTTRKLKLHLLSRNEERKVDESDFRKAVCKNLVNFCQNGWSITIQVIHQAHTTSTTREGNYPLNKKIERAAKHVQVISLRRRLLTASKNAVLLFLLSAN